VELLNIDEASNQVAFSGYDLLLF